MVPFMQHRQGSQRPFKARLVVALVIAGFALLSYYSQSETNSITGRTQRIAMTRGQEIALGLQAAPRMAQQFGGLDRRAADADRVARIGARLLAGKTLAGSDYEYHFHLLADAQTINAFALPGGPVFMTRGLYDRLPSDAQIAGVLGHEIAHVVARHGAQQLAKQQLTQGLAQATGVAAGDQSGAQLAMMVGNVVNMKYGRADELESDRLGVQFMAEAGYDPRAMVAVMKVLGEAGKAGRSVEFFSTHPNPENRITQIQRAIALQYPGGVPEGLDE